MADNSPKTGDKRTLAEILAERGVLSIRDAAAVALQLVRAVGALHAEGKVHIQICADAVHLNRAMSARLEPTKPEVAIGGIGVDLVPCPPQLHNIPALSLPVEIKAARHVLTKAGILLDPRQIDFYQLGALLCFMVSGHGVSDYLRSCKAKADVPEVIRLIIDRALGFNAKDCFESCESFASDLEAVISGRPAAGGESSHLPESIFFEPLSKPKAQSTMPRDAGSAAEETLPVKMLGHYQIVERIGHGGMGDVYKGYEKALDRYVAIKVLPAELARQEDFVNRFDAEAAAIAKLDHPNIVRIFFSGQDQGHHFFAMQYVDGESLADLLRRRKKLSANEVLPIIEQCLAGIGAAHRIGLIHRDVKPGNVLLDWHSRRALVTDFGVVKAIQAETSITITGTVMGTADYIAPEQARGQDIDGRADLYAIGVLMYQMLSGRLPFHAESATSMMFQHAYEPPPPLSEVAPNVPEKLAGVVMKLMAKKPEDRCQSAEEVLAELQYIRVELVTTTGTSQTSIIEAPHFAAPSRLPRDLIELTGKNWIGRLRNRITDFFGAHAPQIIEHMQTTGQQVDSAVGEYQRQRDRLAELAREAKVVTADLEQQAKVHRNTAHLAGQRAEAATNTTAKHHALKEQHESEQAAAEVAQLAAEQQQQCEGIEMRLAKLDAALVQLRSRRDALNARLKVAKVRLEAEGVPPRPWRPSKRLVRTGVTVLLVCLVAALIHVFWPAAETEQGLIAHWKFDEGSGNTAYDSVGKNHGIIHGATWTTGQIGKALNFDGNDDSVTIGSDVGIADITDNFTISLWANPLTVHELDEESAISWRGDGGQEYTVAPVHGDAMLGRGHAGAGISVGTNGISVYEHGDGHLYSILVWPGAVSGLTHVTVVYENKQPHLYVNGALKKTGLTSPRIVHALPHSIGGAGYDYFKGLIDEVKIYSRVLPAQEIQRLYGVTAGAYEKPQGTEWVDILKLIDVERDTRGGQWRFEDGVLVGFAQSTLETTYELPGEYDVLWEFESESTAINLLLASPAEKRFEWMMKGWSHQLCAIRDVGRKHANANETTTVYPLASGGRYVSELRVRNDKVVALINGEEILNYKTDWSNIEVWDPWHPFELKPRTLGIWLHKHWTRTYRLQVKPHN